MLTWGHQGATGKGKQDMWEAYMSLEEVPGVYRDRAQTVELSDFSRSPCLNTAAILSIGIICCSLRLGPNVRAAASTQS